MLCPSRPKKRSTTLGTKLGIDVGFYTYIVGGYRCVLIFVDSLVFGFLQSI